MNEMEKERGKLNKNNPHNMSDSFYEYMKAFSSKLGLINMREKLSTIHYILRAILMRFFLKCFLRTTFFENYFIN